MMSIKKLLLGVCIIMMFFSFVEHTQAIESQVSTAQELQTALSLAGTNGENDTILLAAGTYKGNFNFSTSEDQSLTIKAMEDLSAWEVVLDGDQKGRVLNLSAAGKNVAFTLERITVQNGKPGGIAIATAGNVVVQGCAILHNSGGYPQKGGGLTILSAKDVFIEGNTVSDNGEATRGGGIYINSAVTATLNRNSVLRNNAYSTGGGIWISATTAILQSNMISNNSSRHESGGIFFYGATIGTTITLDQNRIIGNHANQYGGGVYVADLTSVVNLNGNRVENNTARYGAAGIYLHCSYANVTVVGNIFCGQSITDSNAAEDNAGDGGGLSICALNLDFNNNILIQNSAVRTGGGLLFRASTEVPASTANIINNTFYGNTAASGGGVSFSLPGSTETLNVYNNIIWGNDAGSSGDDIIISGYGASKTFCNNNYHEVAGLWNIALNNIDVAPLFVDQTNGDYHLRANSLCINAGANGAPGLPLTDKDGSERIGNGIVDLGAYEQSFSECHPADTNQNWVIEASEFTAYSDAWRNHQPWGSGPNPVPIDYVTRAGFLLQSGGAYHNEGGGKPGCWVPGL